jgi:hypothetical protein
MIELDLPADRFTIEEGLLVRLEVPTQNHQQVMAAVREASDLRCGDYDKVSFTTTPGIQRFRSLGAGRNRAKETISEWESVEVNFFLPTDREIVEAVLRAIYATHPSEEPVIHILAAARPLHIRGLDEDNPNRFWNRTDSINEL